MKKIYFWSILILSALIFWPVSLFAQESPTDSCQYKLVMQSPYSGGWSGRNLYFSLDPKLTEVPIPERNLGQFTLSHSGTETQYFFLPRTWITVSNNLDYFGLFFIGTFFLYDENDSLVLAGPENLPETFQWYNGCSFDIPDTITTFSHSVQGNAATLFWTNPTTTVHGDALNTISSIEIRRNDELIHTFLDAIPGESLTFSDNVPEDGTYIYTVQCFNEAGGGVPSNTHLVTGNNCTLHNGSHSGHYESVPTCSMNISNDTAYTFDGLTTLTVYQSDTTKMLRISGHAITDSSTHIQVYVGTPENSLQLPSDTVMMITPYSSATFVFDIPAGSSPEFHYTVECVNSLYEQHDTTIAIVPDSNGIIYVTQEGAGLHNGSSWANATPWLNRAMTAADTMIVKPIIWVAKGSYYGTPQMIDGTSYAFVGHDSVNVYGSFVGNEPADYNLALRDFEQNETVLDGLLAHTVVYLGKGSEWNGFYIQRGTNGCKMIQGSTLRHCEVSGCTSNGITSHDYVILIDSCICIDNGGWGIAVYYQSRILNSKISRNASGGVSAAGEVQNCSITQNGGCGYSSLGFDHFRIGVVNCLIANNDGDGISVAECKVTNTTIVNNTGYGLFLRSKPQPIRNCIVYGNRRGTIAKEWYVNEYDLTHCAIDGDYLHTSNRNILLSSPGDTSGFQPCFVNPTAGTGSAYDGGDWHLLPNSVCVNRGVTYSDNYPNIDLDGEPRVQQGLPDIGAFESSHLAQYENGKIIYVKVDGQGNGSSWTDATNDLEYAIESAWIYGSNTQVWVAEGTYPTQGYPFYVKEELILLGGFIGNEPTDYDVNLRNHLIHPSVLDGQNQNRILCQTLDFERPAVVDGFTLTHGQADEGAGAYLMSNTTLSKCRVVNNTVTGEDAAAVTAVRDTLKQLLVENNDGTGVLAESSQVLHCTVVRNNGDGIQVSGNTIQDFGKLCNNIIWGNALQNLHFTSSMAQNNTPVLHCAIENQVVDGEYNITLSSDNENVSGPRFVNPSDSMGVVNNLGDWHLDSSSVCVNAGAELSDLYGIHTDLAGQLRVQNEKADIGVIESPYSGKVLCRNMEIFIYEGESYTFYGTTLTAAGWYEHRWNVGEADSLVVLHLITKQVVYVSVTGAGNMDGSSWANALDGQTATADGSTKLAEALQAATVGTEFWIQSGTYYACSDSDINKSLMLNSGVALYGGFAGIETAISQRDSNNAPTVFSGNLQNDSIIENRTRYIFKTNERNTPDNPILLDNISITEGYNDIHVHEGSALRVNVSSSVKASHCRIHHNFGGAVVNEGLFTGYYCTLDSNESHCDYWDSYLGAAALINRNTGLANINHCVVAYNQAPTDGAIFNNGILWIDSSQINRNQATSGTIGAIRNEGLLTILNSHLSYNKSYEEYSIIASSGPLKMDNCTLEYNQTNMRNPLYYWPGERWAAIISSAHIMVSGNAEVTHCLFRRNSQNAGNGGGCLHVNGHATILHCDFVENVGSGNSASSFVTWGNGEEEESSGGIVIHTVMETGHIDGGGVHVSGKGEVYVEDCLFDRQCGKRGSAASVESGKLIMNRCRFTHNIANDDCFGGVLDIQSGELYVMNSLFANNQDLVFNTEKTANSKLSFSNCTFANNGARLCCFTYPIPPFVCDTSWVNTDTAHVNFNNCIITGYWGHDMLGLGQCDTSYYPNYTLDFTNTLFDTLHSTPQIAKTANLASQTISVVSDGATDEISTISLADAQRLLANQLEGNLVMRYDAEMQDYVIHSATIMTEKQDYIGGKSLAKDGDASDCTPDSLGNIYYCDPMFVNPTTVMGMDSAQNPLLYDFRLQDGSPAINSGDTTGLHLTADATDLDGEQRVKRCQIDRGCYEYGTIVYDTVRETLCVEQNALNQLSYIGHGFSIEQLEVGENTFTRTCDCHPDANDSVQTLQLAVSLIQHSEFEAVACDSMVWNGITYIQSGTYTQTLSDRAGCDSVVTLHLTVNHSVATDDYLTLCENELPYTYGDTVFEVGTPEFSIFHFQFSTTKGCDSLVTLHLTVHEAVETDIYDYLCNGSTYPFFGQELIFPGTYTHVGQTAHGCDSTVTLHLELKQTYSSFLNVNLCNGEGYDFFGETLHDAGTYTQTVPTEFGCDSTIVLTITTGTTTYGDLNASICDGSSYNFYGQQLTESGDYTVTLTNSHGCDSIVTLHLTINSAYHTDIHVSACDTYVWGGQTYSASGDYDKTFTAANGCDSVVTLHLTINPSVATDEYLTISQDELPYTYGDTVFEAGTPEFSIFHFPFSTADGCDSTVTLHLTITVGINDHTGAAMTVYPNPTTGVVNVQCTMNNVQAEAMEFQLFDAFGRLLRIADGVEANNHSPLQTDTHDSSVQTQIDLSEFAAGVYYIKAVADGNVIAVRKVIKN